MKPLRYWLCWGCNWRFRHSSASTSSSQDTPPARCLLLGLSGSGKTTFLYRLKTGEFFDVKPTDGFEVEEIEISGKGSPKTISFSEVANSDRRTLRLQFLQSLPMLATGILFFLDITNTPERVAEALDELTYALTYTHLKGCRIRFLGIALNKQDLLVPAGRSVVVGARNQVQEALRNFERAQPECSFPWAILGDGLVSAKTGIGMKEVLEGLIAGLKGDERPKQKKAVSSNKAR